MRFATAATIWSSVADATSMRKAAGSTQLGRNRGVRPREDPPVGAAVVRPEVVGAVVFAHDPGDVGDGGGGLERQPAVVAAGHRRDDEVLRRRELAVEVQERRPRAGQQGVDERRRIARRLDEAVLADRHEALAAEVGVGPRGRVGGVVHEMAVPAVHGLAGERPGERPEGGAQGLEDRVALGERGVDPGHVRGEELREARLEKEALADGDLRGIEVAALRLDEGRRSGAARDARQPGRAARPAHARRLDAAHAERGQDAERHEPERRRRSGPPPHSAKSPRAHPPVSVWIEIQSQSQR